MMQTEGLKLPSSMPVMALSGVTLFPNALLPLYIFEPRYRRMLASVLEGDRIFAVGMVRPDTGEETVFPVAGAGLVRACVGQADGTSQLILQGIGRVRFDTFPQTEPYLVGRTEPVTTVNDDPEATQKAGAELQEICLGLISRGIELPEQFTRAVGEMNDPSALGDLVAQHLVREPLSAQEVLAETNLPARLRRLVAVLRLEWQQFPG
jgi:Lon protease-like protein